MLEDLGEPSPPHPPGSQRHRKRQALQARKGLQVLLSLSLSLEKCPRRKMASWGWGRHERMVCKWESTL